MNWESALVVLRNGGKIAKPNWEAEHFWTLSKDLFERIICHDGTHAKVHAQQLESTDWGLWRSPSLFEDICDRKRIFSENCAHAPNTIMFPSIPKEVSGLAILGMQVVVDSSLAPGEFIICYEKPKPEPLWRKRIGNPHFYGDAFKLQDVRDAIRRLKADWRVNNGDASCRAINEIFGDQLC